MAKKVTWQEVGATKGIDLLSPAFVTSGSKLVFTSGCIGSDPVTDELPEDLEQQARNALQNLRNVLEASGSNSDRVLKVLLFVADGAYSQTVNRIYREQFPNSPARSCVVVSFPNPKIKVELECIAEVQPKARWFKL
ncbi:hypothetical protein ACU8KH_04207 [Lachancea thermotolerans]